MATPDDIKLLLAVETAGVEGVTKLANEIDKLAKEGGSAAPEFEKLASELNRIAAQGTAVAELKQISDAAKKIADDFGIASARADELRAALDQQKSSTEAARQAYTQADIAVKQTANGINVLKEQQRTLRQTTDDAKKGTDEYKNAVQSLRTRIEELTARKGEERIALDAAGKAQAEANKALRDAESAYKNAVSAANSLSAANDKQNAALKESLSSLAKAGIEADNLASAEEQLTSAMAAARAETEKQVTAYENRKRATAQLAEAERILQAQLQLEADIAQAAIAEQEKLAAAELEAANAAKVAADARKAAVQAEIAEEDRLLAVVEATRLRQKQAALEEYRAIQTAAQEAAAREVAIAEERSAKIRAMAEQAQQQLSDAFAKTGVRSISAIQAEIAQIQQAMLSLSRSASVSAADFDRAWQAGQNRIKALETELRTIPGHISATAQVTDLLRNQFVQLAAAYSTIELGRKFIDANVQIESLRRALTLVTGSSQEAAKEIEFLRNTANTSGQDVGALSETFIKFAASAKASGIPLETMQGVFRGITNAAGQLGISSARTSLMLEALGQMANKGTVSMEELRQQLGDSLPGAMSIAAKGLGLTESELVKLVETGNLTTREFFPAFRKGLEQTFGDSTKRVDGFLQAWNRLKNAILETAQGAADSQGWKDLAAAMDFLAKNVGTVTTAIVDLGKAFLAFKAIQVVAEWTGISKVTKEVAASTAVATAATVANTEATAANTIAKRANAAAWAEIAAGVGASRTATVAAGAAATESVGLFSRLGGAVAGFGRTALAAVGGLPGVLTALAFSYKDLGKWIGESTAELFKNYNGIEESRKRSAELTKQQEAAAKAQQAAAQAVSEGWSRVSITYNKLITDEENTVISKKKLAEASKVAAENSINLANLIGNESLARETAVTATQKQLAASETEQKAIEKEVQLRKEQIEKLKAYVAENGGLEAAANKVYKDKIETLENLMKQREAEAERTKQNTEAVRLEVTQRRVALETYKDNASRVEELTRAVKDAKDAEQFMAQMLKEGMTTQQAYNATVQKAAETEALLNDALKDAAAAADRKIAALQRTATQTEANLNIDKARIQTEGAYLQRLLESARAEESYATRMGDTARAVQAAIDQKNIEIRIVSNSIDMKEMEIKVLRAKIDASNAEAKATLAAAEAEKASLEATNSLTEAKKAEIEARIASAKLKQTEAQLNAENIKQIEEEISALRAKRSIAADEAYTAEAAKESEIAARERNISAIDGETAALKRKRGVDEQGFSTDMAGNRIVATGDTPLSAYNALKSYGVEDARAKQIASSLFDAYGNTITNYGSITTNPMLGENFGTLLAKIAQQEVLNNNGVAQTGSTGGSTQSASSGAVPVVVNINGVPQTVMTNSKNDADTLVRIFQTAYSQHGFRPLG